MSYIDDKGKIVSAPWYHRALELWLAVCLFFYTLFNVSNTTTAGQVYADPPAQQPGAPSKLSPANSLRQARRRDDERRGGGGRGGGGGGGGGSSMSEVNAPGEPFFSPSGTRCGERRSR